VTPGDLAGEPLILYERGGTIRQGIEDLFRRGRVTPRVAMELGNGAAIKELVSAGLGPSITSWASVRSEARAGSLLAIPLSPALVTPPAPRVGRAGRRRAARQAQKPAAPRPSPRARAATEERPAPQLTLRSRPAQYGSRSLNFCSLPVAVRTSVSRTSMVVGHL